MDLTPQRQEFLKLYLDPKSPSFSNALQSGLKAGFSQEYSESITYQMPDWLAEALGNSRNSKRLEKSISNLEEIQELSIKNEEGKIIPEILKERTKVDMFITERLGKEEGFSTRTELTGKKGEDLIKTIVINKFPKDETDN